MVQSSGMTNKNVTVWFPVKSTERTKSQTTLRKNKKSIQSPVTAYSSAYLNKITDKCLIRYNLQFIKCTVCIVQDKVVKVVKLSAPVRLWDSGTGDFVWEWCLHPSGQSSHHLKNTQKSNTVNRPPAFKQQFSAPHRKLGFNASLCLVRVLQVSPPHSSSSRHQRVQTSEVPTK